MKGRWRSPQRYEKQRMFWAVERILRSQKSWDAKLFQHRFKIRLECSSVDRLNLSDRDRCYGRRKQQSAKVKVQNPADTTGWDRRTSTIGRESTRWSAVEKVMMLFQQILAAPRNTTQAQGWFCAKSSLKHLAGLQAALMKRRFRSCSKRSSACKDGWNGYSSVWICWYILATKLIYTYFNLIQTD